jgi:hypothetical protein
VPLSLAFFRLTYRFNISKVLGSARRTFCGHQVSARYEVCSQTASPVDNALNPTLPRCIEVDAGNLRQNIDGHRLATDMKKRAAFREVGSRQSLERRAELRQGRINGFCVFGVGLYQNARSFVARG